MCFSWWIVLLDEIYQFLRGSILLVPVKHLHFQHLFLGCDFFCMILSGIGCLVHLACFGLPDKLLSMLASDFSKLGQVTFRFGVIFLDIDTLHCSQFELALFEQVLQYLLISHARERIEQGSYILVLSHEVLKRNYS